MSAQAGRRNLVNLLAGLFFIAPSVSAIDAPAAKPKNKLADFSVSWQPARPVNGSPVVFRVTSTERLKSLSGKWLEHEVFFSSDSLGKVWYGIAGASLETHPGNYPLELKGATASGKDLSFQKQVTVGKGKYHSIVASVPKQYTEPSVEQLKEIDQDKALKEHLFTGFTPERQWAGSFHPPA